MCELKRIQSKTLAKFPQSFKSGSLGNYLKANSLRSEHDSFLIQDKIGPDGASNPEGHIFTVFSL